MQIAVDHSVVNGRLKINASDGALFTDQSPTQRFLIWHSIARPFPDALFSSGNNHDVQVRPQDSAQNILTGKVSADRTSDNFLFLDHQNGMNMRDVVSSVTN